MNHKWLNDKQPDDNGDITAVVENSEGVQVSVFKGKTIEEVADKLLIGATSANREIARLYKKTLRPDKGRTPMKAQNRVLSADDKFRLASEMSDPDKVVNAVQEIVNSTAKVPLNEIAEKTLENDKRQSDEFYVAEAMAFRKEVPEYYNTDKNRDALFDELKANGWDLTRNNLAIAYNTLKERGDIEPWPIEGATRPTEPDREDGSSNNSAPAVATPPIEILNGQPEPAPPPSPRPRSTATGIRNSDASALPPPPNRKKQYTRADIELMSRTEYTRKLQEEPGFRQQVDAMGS
jgi:hypothetical protein